MKRTDERPWEKGLTPAKRRMIEKLTREIDKVLPRVIGVEAMKRLLKERKRRLARYAKSKG
jgi:hypothetical protein